MLAPTVLLGQVMQLLLGQSPSVIDPPAPHPMHSIVFEDTWHVLGPFQIGTREWQWGADPLEFYGGFHHLQHTTSATFPSSIASNGLVAWSELPVESHTGTASVKVDLEVSFANVEWPLLQSVYGWAAFQHQAWARGHFSLESADGSPRTCEIYTDHLVEIWIDGTKYFGGDFYGFRRAPLVVQLAPGRHVFDVRLVHDVRSMGGIGAPFIQAAIEIKSVESAMHIASESGCLLADVVDGILASPFASIAVRNTGDEVQFVEDVAVTRGNITIQLIASKPLAIYPGQTRPIAFNIAFAATAGSSAEAAIRSRSTSSGNTITLPFEIEPVYRQQSDMHKLTYLHPSGIVSYAMIRPPRLTEVARSTEPLPVLVNLHGAGVDADSEMAIHALDDVSDLPAWTISPSGVTSWCGDDWHEWGWADIDAAIAAIPTWTSQVGWKGPGADPNRLLMVGHSNGGQGVWYSVLHHPDRIIAAAAVSGYASIQKSMPVVGQDGLQDSITSWRRLWICFHTEEAAPRCDAVLQAVLANYRHELLLDNAKGVPLLVQHGSADDNVPVFHARRMVQLAKSKGLSVEYHELAGKGHYWDGVMTTEPLKKFYQEQLKVDRADRMMPSSFQIVVANPAEHGSMYGMRIETLLDPGDLGRLVVRSTGSQVEISTFNVGALNLESARLAGMSVSLNGQVIELGETKDGKLGMQIDTQGTWSLKQASISAPPFERSGNQLGNMNALLRSKGPFTIVCDDASTLDTALRISRNFYQYFAADAGIVVSADAEITTLGNVILLGQGPDFDFQMDGLPISIHRNAVHITTDPSSHSQSKQITNEIGQEGLAAIFLSPMDGERLQLVVWGDDLASLKIAARLVPLVTGTGQPDFIVVSRETSWRGLEGALAMGFFDSRWQVTGSSFLLKEDSRKVEERSVS